MDRLHPTLDGGSHIARERSENVYKFRVYALIKLNAGRIPIVAVLNEAWQQQQQRQRVTIAVTQRRRLMRRLQQENRPHRPLATIVLNSRAPAGISNDSHGAYRAFGDFVKYTDNNLSTVTTLGIRRFV